MKKVICAAAAFLMAASLTACSGQSGDSAAAVAGNAQQADGYPNKTIQVIVPFNAGSTTDTQCRFILPHLEKELGVSMAIVNNGGASGVIGTTDFLSRDADGYNVLFSLPTPTLYKPAAGETEYAVEDLQPISEVFSAPMYLIVKNDSPYENAEQLIDFIKENPGKFSYANAGNGGIAQLAFGIFLNGEGLDATSVPSAGGSADNYTAVMGGHVDSYSGNEAELLGRDDVRPIINLGSKSTNPEYADIPTLEELGYDGYCTDTYSGFYFSKDVAPEIVEKFDAAVKKVLEDPEVIAEAEKQSLTLSYADSETFAAEIAQSKEAITPVLEELGFKK